MFIGEPPNSKPQVPVIKQKKFNECYASEVFFLIYYIVPYNRPSSILNSFYSQLGNFENLRNKYFFKPIGNSIFPPLI